MHRGLHTYALFFLVVLFVAPPSVAALAQDEQPRCVLVTLTDGTRYAGTTIGPDATFSTRLQLANGSIVGLQEDNILRIAAVPTTGPARADTLNRIVVLKSGGVFRGELMRFVPDKEIALWLGTLGVREFQVAELARATADAKDVALPSGTSMPVRARLRLREGATLVGELVYAQTNGELAYRLPSGAIRVLRQDDIAENEPDSSQLPPKIAENEAEVSQLPPQAGEQTAGAEPKLDSDQVWLRVDVAPSTFDSPVELVVQSRFEQKVWVPATRGVWIPVYKAAPSYHPGTPAHFESRRIWSSVCAPPCLVRGDRAALYRFKGPKVPGTDAFYLPDVSGPKVHVVLSVRRPVNAGYRLGLATTIVGGVLVFPFGATFLAVGASGGSQDPSGGPIRTVGGALLGTGLKLLATGVGLLIGFRPTASVSVSGDDT